MAFETTMWSVLEAARRQSADAADEIVRRYRPPIVQYLRRRLGEADAEDLAQEICVEICKPEFLHAADRARGRFRVLILTVVRRRLANHRRDAAALKRSGDLPPEPESEGPDVEFDRMWVRNLVARATERLAGEAPHQAKAVALFYDEGLPYEEIARRLDKSVADVTNYLHHGRERLRKLVRQAIEEYVGSYEELQDEVATLLKHL